MDPIHCVLPVDPILWSLRLPLALRGLITQVTDYCLDPGVPQVADYPVSGYIVSPLGPQGADYSVGDYCVHVDPLASPGIA